MRLPFARGSLVLLGALVGCGSVASTGSGSSTTAQQGSGDGGTGTSSGGSSDGGTVRPAGDAGSETFFVRAALVPPLPTNGACDYTADVTDPTESTGVVDVSFHSLSAYTPTLLVEDTQLGATETSRLIVNGASTTVTDAAGDATLEAMFARLCAGGTGDPAACSTGKKLASGTLIPPKNPFSSGVSTAIEPATASGPGLTAVAVTLLDSATITVLRDYFTGALTLGGSEAFTSSIVLLAATQLHATTLGGTTATSPAFTFPVRIGFADLVTNLNAAPSGIYCVNTAEKVPASPQVCVPGQDSEEIVSEIPGLGACTM